MCAYVTQEWHAEKWEMGCELTYPDAPSGAVRSWAAGDSHPGSESRHLGSYSVPCPWAKGVVQKQLIFLILFSWYQGPSKP